MLLPLSPSYLPPNLLSSLLSLLLSLLTSPCYPCYHHSCCSLCSLLALYCSLSTLLLSHTLPNVMQQPGDA